MAEITGEIIKTAYSLYDPNDTVIVRNPLDYDFEFGVQGSRYIVQAGDKAEMPGYMANNFVKNVVDELMQRDKKLIHLNNKDERAKYVSQVEIQVRPAIAPVQASQNTEPRVLSTTRNPDVAGAVGGGDHELPAVKSDAETLSAEQLERLHPTDDGRGRQLPKEEEAFPGLKTRNDLMKEAKDLGLPVEPTDTKESLTQKITAQQTK